MTSDTRTSDDIERDIVDERAQMSNSFNNLQKKFSVDSIVNDLGDMLRDQGGELGRSISRTVGRNPAAIVLVGVGLAWLFLGHDRNRFGHAKKQQADQKPDHLDASAKSAKLKQQKMLTDRPSNGLSNGVMGAARNGASAVGTAISDAAHSVDHAAPDLTERVSDGLDTLSDDAKAGMVSVKRAAHEARRSSEAMMNKGARAASHFFNEQPLVVGALAMALGAAIGGILPHSKIEDDAMGNSSDHLFAGAQVMFREERDKAIATLKVAAADVKNEVSGVGSDLADLLPDGKTVGNVIVDRVSDAATRVFDHATGKVVGDQQLDRSQA